MTLDIARGDLLELAATDVPLWRQVVRLHRANPTWGATRIALAIGRSDAYVRATAQRHDLQLPRSRYAEVPSHGAAYSAKRRATLSSHGDLLKALTGLVDRIEEAWPALRNLPPMVEARAAIARTLLKDNNNGNG